MTPDLDHRVVIRHASCRYPTQSPFHPSERYPEYGSGAQLSVEPNDAYRLVRQVLVDSGLDRANQGSSAWNPLGEFIQSGQTVLIKPNMVLDRHLRGGDIQCIITHGSVLRAIADYVLIALKGRGRLVFGDSPLQTTSFEGVLESNGLGKVVKHLRSISTVQVDLVDFRNVHAERDEGGHIVRWKEVPGDPSGTVTLDPGGDSALSQIDLGSDLFRVSNYAAEDTAQYHRHGSHRYVLARSVLDSDVIISVPKLKTHCKVGVTLSMKNFVGTVCRKQCLAHHREGSPRQGGDEYPVTSVLKRISEKLERYIDGRSAGMRRALAKFAFRVNERLIRELRLDPVRDGGWHGNDTCWRMTVDLVRLALYGTVTGRIADQPQRRILTFIDGIVAGENEGPLESTPLQAGTIVFGANPLSVDLAAARWMGFDPSRIPLLAGARAVTRWPILAEGGAPIAAIVNGEVIDELQLGSHPQSFRFASPVGWRGHMELGARRAS